MDTQNNKLKLDFLKLSGLVKTCGYNSRLVRSAVCAARARLRLKNYFKQLWLSLSRKRQKPAAELKALIYVKGGIGDAFISRFLAAALREALPKASIFYAHHNAEAAKTVFGDGKFINQIINPDFIIKDYDIVLSGCYVYNYDYYNRRRIRTLAPAFEAVLDKGLAMQKILSPIIENSPYLDGALSTWCEAQNLDRFGSISLSTGLEVSQNRCCLLELRKSGFDILKNFGLQNKQYITIHDGLNNETVTNARSPRLWPKEHWRQLVKMLKKDFPYLTIVQLGGSNSAKFDFADISLVGKTQIKDLPYILAKSALHIDSESGLVHMAFSVKTKSVVLFGPTTVKTCGYKDNINIEPAECKGCYWAAKDWMLRCPLSLGDNDCMSSIIPQTVYIKVKEYLNLQQC